MRQARRISKRDERRVFRPRRHFPYGPVLSQLTVVLLMLAAATGIPVLLNQLPQQDSDPCGSSQHQHDNRQLTQDGAIGEAATGAKDPSLITFAASACLPHGIGVIRVPSLGRF